MIRTLENLVAFKRIPRKIVLATLLASWMLQVGMIVQQQPLYIIVLFTLLPWVPVFLFESLWKIEHYHWIAIFAVIVVLQLGHLGEHVAQTGALVFTNATLACPPPVDSAANAQRAIDAGLRRASSAPTGLSAAVIVMPDSSGSARLDANGQPVSGPPACGVFGQLDLEIVHLIWEVAGWLLAMLLVVQFPRSRWLWLTAVLATVHTVEHLFISYTFFLDPTAVYAGTRQLWGTVANGSIVTAYPLGGEPALVNFYAVAGKNGILARGGLVGALFPSLNAGLPTRPFLHLYYNAAVTIPLVIGFVQVARRTYDRYLARAVPGLTTQELVAVTPELEPVRFKPGDVIVREGDLADYFYVVSKGEVEVVREHDGVEQVVSRLGEGEFFGELGLLNGGKRTATVRASTPVEVMRLNRQTFSERLALKIKAVLNLRGYES